MIKSSSEVLLDIIDANNVYCWQWGCFILLSINQFEIYEPMFYF